MDMTKHYNTAKLQDKIQVSPARRDAESKEKEAEKWIEIKKKEIERRQWCTQRLSEKFREI